MKVCFWKVLVKVSTSTSKSLTFSLASLAAFSAFLPALLALSPAPLAFLPAPASEEPTTSALLPNPFNDPETISLASAVLNNPSAAAPACNDIDSPNSAEIKSLYIGWTFSSAPNNVLACLPVSVNLFKPLLISMSLGLKLSL